MFNSKTIILELQEAKFKHFADGIQIAVGGYLMPRNDIFKQYHQLSSEDLVFELFKKFEHNFVKQVKGIFYVVIKTEQRTFIFNDRLGFKKLFYALDENAFIISDDISCISHKVELKINPNALAHKALLNRESHDVTLFENIKTCPPATQIQVERNAISIEQYWSPAELNTNVNKAYTIPYFEGLLKENLSNIDTYFKPKQYAITLTGGKDSRTGLCALMNLNLKTVGLTYGDPKSKDAVFAKALAQKADIPHQVFEMPKTKTSLESTFNQIVDLKNPAINLHRAHRFFAFQELKKISDKDQVYIAGYMAGELLMGIYYDDLVFPNSLTDIWENKSNLDKETIESALDKHFIRKSSVSTDSVLIELSKLRTLASNQSHFQKHLYGIFELGIPHHSQDVFLSHTILDYPYPLFLDIDFLDALFQSKYSFKYTNNKTKNLFERYKLYYFNLKLQNRLYPKLSSVPFAKKGNYTTKDYLRGNLWWSGIKVVNFLRDKKKYPPTFVYDETYYRLILDLLNQIAQDTDHLIHEVFDVNRAVDELKKSQKLTQEKYWHKYTNIVSCYLYFNKLQHENKSNHSKE